ncbi:MAG: hydroxyacid dehydrogenase [Pseudomonadota bacterium]|nr:hydroxyacid dehydrogenase [Pseudomonadota bacterium]
MKTNKKNLIFFEKWMDPVAETILACESDIILQRLTFDTVEDENWAIIEKAHGIQLLPTFETQHPFFPDQAFIERCPNLLAFSVTGAGYDMVDLQACSEAGILLVNQGGANSESVAQHVLGLMLALSKQIIQGDRQMRSSSHGWGRWDFLGAELTDRTLGIIGLGKIGQRVSELAVNMFNMKVLAYDPYLSKNSFLKFGVESVGLDDVFRHSDFVSVHCPLTEETTNMIGDRQYRMMKSSAYFISTARGGIHDEVALAGVLSEELIAGAGLDVFSPEPPSITHPLMEFNNVILSPHIAGITADCTYKMASWAADQWVSIFNGNRPPRLINEEVWDHYRERFKRIIGQPVKD